MADYETKDERFGVEASELLSNFLLEMNDLAYRHKMDPIQYIKDTGCLIISMAVEMENKLIVKENGDEEII